MNAGTFVPKNFRSRERKFHRVELSLPGTKVPWNFRSLELSFPGTFAPRNESSLELSFPGTFAPWNFRSLELWFPSTNSRSQSSFWPPQIASKVTEISRVSVVMYVSDEIVVWQMQLTNPRDPSIKLGFWVGTRLKRQQK